MGCGIRSGFCLLCNQGSCKPRIRRENAVRDGALRWPVIVYARFFRHGPYDVRSRCCSFSSPQPLSRATTHDIDLFSGGWRIPSLSDASYSLWGFFPHLWLRSASRITSARGAPGTLPHLRGSLRTVQARFKCFFPSWLTSNAFHLAWSTTFSRLGAARQQRASFFREHPDAVVPRY